MSAHEEMAANAEKDAKRRIERSQQEAEEFRRSADQRIDNLRDEYERRELTEEERQEAAIERQKVKGYERLRELQRTQQSEIDRVRRDGERDVKKLDEFYKSKVFTTERDGAEKLQQINVSHARQIDFEKRMKDAELEENRVTNLARNEEIKADGDAKRQKLESESRKEYERVRDTYGEANRKAEETYQRKFAEKSTEQNRILDDMDNRTSTEIRRVRGDHSRKLAAYSERQNDPFYQLLDLRAEVEDDGDFYVLRAKIPEHEQRHVSVSVKGDQLVLTGYRRNEEKLEIEPGRTKGTNAFQSYLETFPISWPVDASKMTREFEGDELVVRVPKKTERSYQPPKPKTKPARARVERPHFPDNLPLAHAPDENSGADAPTPTRKSKGSGTLT